MPKKIYVDSDNCIGCTLCTQICESVFAMKDDGKSGVIKEEIVDSQESTVQTAIDICPVRCIHWK